MKRSLLFLMFFGIVGLSGAMGQDKVTEAYFHELQGMEDSSGVTHLFYRLYKKQEVKCGAYNDETGEYEASSGTHTKNNIYHFDTRSNSDSVFISNYSGVENFCGYFSSVKTSGLIFFDAHPDSIMLSHTTTCCIDAIDGKFTDYKSRNLRTNTSNIFYDYEDQKFVFDYKKDPYGWEESFISTALHKNDSLWFQDEPYYPTITKPDSLIIPFRIKGISPYNHTYIGVTPDSLIASFDKGNTIAQVLSPFEFRNYKTFSFASDTSILFTTSAKFFGEPDYYNQYSLQIINFGNNNITIDTLYTAKQDFRFDFAPNASSNLFLSDSLNLLVSTNYGQNFELLTSFGHEITGLYKKPDSDILYVLTREELQEVNTQTKAITSLKQIPVSSEQLPNVPTQITLEQNYPNPFNPTTVISYQLDSNQLVQLEVFDVTGRKVATLVDGKRQSAGNQQVTFEASGLSSGVYFYRLETGGQTLTRKMLLVK